MKAYSVVSLIGPDRPGSVDAVSRIAAERRCNIEDSRMAVLGGNLETAIRPAPFTGTPTFAMHVDISSSGQIPLEELRRALQELARDEDIHITLGKAL